MKKIIILSLALSFAFNVFGQMKESAIYKADNVVFFGIDFTSLKLVGKDGFINKNGKPMCKSFAFKYCEEWNEMFILEEEKFNISKYFGFKNYTLEQETVTERNSTYPETGCIVDSESYKVSKEDITAIAANYSSKEKKEGVGLLVVAESFNKTRGLGKFYNVFIDLSNSEVIKIEFQQGGPGGYGFRNYWINAFNAAWSKNAKYYKQMRKKY